MSNIIEKARAYRKAILIAMPSIDDKIASTAIELLPKLKEDGSLVSAGTRINWHGIIKKATVDLWDITENNPDSAPSLWEDLDYRSGYRIIPEVITVGTAFAKDEYGWWGDILYKSLLDANVYTPVSYPNGWEQVNIQKTID